MTLKFDTSNDLPDSAFNNYLNQYKHWCDAKSFYQSRHIPLISIDPAGIPMFYYSNIDQINLSSSDIIAIDCLTEGLHSATYFNQYNKNKHYIIFANGVWKETGTIKINYTLITHLFFLFGACDTYLASPKFGSYIDKDYKFDYPKSCIFTSLIGNVRKERSYLVDNLLKNLNYKNYILRYSGEDLGLASDDLDVVRFTKGKFDPYSPISSLDSKYYHTISTTIPINMYNQSYFNLIVESDIDFIDNFFLTEKTIKSLIVGMPFIVVSTPYFLKNLNQLGFKTYSELWDESYDIETDYKKRIDKITTLVNSLETFDWDKHRDKLIEISNKNKLMFLNMNKLADIEFYNFEKQITKFL